ncbi:hypothetical protein BGZ76_000555 [Entomortierella beljakovae]|nr:hypothetical protein BGZ76_000555 [Entomortierella beljakovae]
MGWISSLFEYDQVSRLPPTKSNKSFHILFQFLSILIAAVIAFHFSCEFYSDEYNRYGCEKLDLNTGDYTFETTSISPNTDESYFDNRYTLELLNATRWGGGRGWAESCNTKLETFKFKSMAKSYRILEDFRITCKNITFRSKQLYALDTSLFPARFTNLILQEIYSHFPDIEEGNSTGTKIVFLSPTEDGMHLYYTVYFEKIDGDYGVLELGSNITQDLVSQTMREILNASRINLRFTCTSCYMDASEVDPTSFLRLISIGFPLYRGFMFVATLLLDYMYEYRSQEHLKIDQAEAIPLTKNGKNLLQIHSSLEKSLLLIHN